MRVLPMLRGLIGAITVFAWALLAIGPNHKVKDRAVDDLHQDISSASQPLSRKTLSELADANHSDIGKRRASSESSQLGAAPGQALMNDRDAAALPGTSQDLSVGPQTSRKAELENSRPERADIFDLPATANWHASRSPAASPNPAPGAEMAGIPPLAPRATVDLASRSEGGRADEDVARKSSSASGDPAQSPAPTSPSPDSSARDTASSDAKSVNEAPTIASLLPEVPTDLPRAPQVFGEHETDSSEPLADTSQPAKLPPPLPTIPDYGDGVSSDARHGSEASPIAPSLSEVPIPAPVAAAKPQQQSTGGPRRPGAAEAGVGKSLQPAPSVTAPFSSEDGQPEPKVPTTVAASHSKSAVGGAHAADAKRSSAIGFAPHSTGEKVTVAMRLDGRGHAPKIGASKRMTARTGESGRSGSAPTFVDEKNRTLSSIRTAVSQSEAQRVQWRLALRRRCPSIIASADEYDDDLVRLCRLSAGL